MDRKTGKGSTGAANRRDFLKLAAAGAPAVAVAAVAGGEAEAAPVTVKDGDARLASTEHTRKYFETARF